MDKKKFFTMLLEGLALFGIVCLATVMRVNAYRDDPALSRDGFLYLMQTEDILNGKIKKNGQPQLYQWLVAQNIRLTGWSTEVAAVSVNIAAGVLGIIPIWLLARHLFVSLIPAFLAAVGMVFWPPLVKISIEAQRESCYLLAFCWLLYWLFRHNQQSWFSAVLGGALLAVGTHFRWEMLEFIPIIGAMWGWQWFRNKFPRRLIVRQSLVLGGSFISILLAVAWSIAPGYLSLFLKNFGGRFGL